MAQQKMREMGREFVSRRYPGETPVLAYKNERKRGVDFWWVMPEGQEGVAIWTEKEFEDVFIRRKAGNSLRKVWRDNSWRRDTNEADSNEILRA